VARDKSLRLISALDREEKYGQRIGEIQAKINRSIDDGRASRSSISRYNNQIAKAERQRKSAATEASNLVAEATPKRSYKKFAPTVQKRADAAERERKREAAKKQAATRRARPQSEFEIGVDYMMEDGAKKSSQVMFNWRISRADGGKMTMAEAKDVARELHRGAAASDLRDYEIRGVNWQRPQWTGEKSGNVDDLENFSDILQTVDLKSFRIGAVKPEEA
jgi:glucan-binding YG repeat protein